jgi:hypothetical protein
MSAAEPGRSTARSVSPTAAAVGPVILCTACGERQQAEVARVVAGDAREGAVEPRMRQIAEEWSARSECAAVEADASPLGRPSIDPVLLIRMLIVGCAFAIRSERALCEPSDQANWRLKLFGSRNMSYSRKLVAARKDNPPHG